MAWTKKLGTTPTTRSRSGKQESRIAKALSGKVTINSGATLGQNDVLTDYAEIEAKITAKDSYRFSAAEWKKLVDKSDKGKIPLFVISLLEGKEELVTLRFSDLLFLINLANED